MNSGFWQELLEKFRVVDRNIVNRKMIPGLTKLLFIEDQGPLSFLEISFHNFHNTLELLFPFSI